VRLRKWFLWFVFCVCPDQTRTECMLVRNSLTEALQSRLPAAQWQVHRA
jgi:hypothetical protein